MAKVTIEKTNPVQVAAQQSQPVRLSDRLYAEVEELQRQIDELPDRIKAHKELAAESLDDKVVVESIQAARELELTTLPALKLRLWHKQKDYLQAHKADLITMEIEMRDGQVAVAKEDFDTAEAILGVAKAQLAKAEQRFKTIAGELRGVGIQRQDLEAEIQKHENSKPIIK